MQWARGNCAPKGSIATRPWFMDFEIRAKVPGGDPGIRAPKEGEQGKK